MAATSCFYKETLSLSLLSPASCLFLFKILLKAAAGAQPVSEAFIVKARAIALCILYFLCIPRPLHFVLQARKAGITAAAAALSRQVEGHTFSLGGKAALEVAVLFAAAVVTL